MAEPLADPPNASPPLFQIVYVSSAVRPFSSNDLAHLLAQARTRNTAADVTGMLLYHDGNFMQLLEGGEKQVRETYERIKEDPRHTGIITLIQAPTSERICGDWSMGLRSISSEEVGTSNGGLNGFLKESGRKQSTTKQKKALRLLYQFRESLR